MPKPPGVIRRFLAAHPRVVDGALVLFLLAFTLLPGDLQAPETAFWDPVGGAWVFVGVGTAVALWWRRRRPRTVAAIVILTNLLVLLQQGAPLELRIGDAAVFAAAGATLVPVGAALYAVAVYHSTRWAALMAVGAVVILDGVEWLADEFGRWQGSTLFLAVVVVLIGANVGNRRRWLQAILDRADQLARERDTRAQLAVAEERGRIARELHDVVAHGLSVIVRLSDGADAVADTDPDRARLAVRQIGEVGRDSLRDMRRLLGVLSDDDTAPELAPQPTLADLDALVETYRSAGLPVAVERQVEGDLDAATQLVVYRAAQEGLTNALRYATAPTRVLLAIRAHVDAITVEVVDDGDGAGPAPSVGTERGIVGLRERAALYGGEVTAAPRAERGGRGWRLRVVLPRHPDAEPRSASATAPTATTTRADEEPDT